MVRHGVSSAGSYLANPTPPIPSHSHYIDSHGGSYEQVSRWTAHPMLLLSVYTLMIDGYLLEWKPMNCEWPMLLQQHCILHKDKETIHKNSNTRGVIVNLRRDICILWLIYSASIVHEGCITQLYNAINTEHAVLCHCAKKSLSTR